MESDIAKAWKIVRSRERWIGPTGQLKTNIAEAVAEGIALGRKEGLELAARLIAAHIETISTTQAGGTGNA
jgi:hypothetical protein